MQRLFLFLFLILCGCNRDAEPVVDMCADNLTATFEPCSSITTVTKDICIIKEVLIYDAEGVLKDKFEYHYDGTNYNRIDRYYREDYSKPLPVTPTETIEFTYYENGLVSQVNFTSFLIENNTSKSESTYTYSENELNIRYNGLNPDGSVGLSYDNNEFYLPGPEDSLYYFNEPVVGHYDYSGLFDFKGGNLIRKGTPSNDGDCILYGKNWDFTKNYYDNLPNVLKNYAVRYPLSFGKIVYGIMSESYVEINSNNIIGRVDKTGTEQYCWEFLKNSSETYWIKEFSGARQASDRLVGFTVTYNYDCE